LPLESGGVRITIKVVARASRDAVLGLKDGVLRVAVRAAPERGRANEAVVALLAVSLGVPRARVSLVAGGTSPRKIVEIEGLDEAEARRRMGVG
jgi:hypothetical protein